MIREVPITSVSRTILQHPSCIYETMIFLILL